jgi:hypothetical protein
MSYVSSLKAKLQALKDEYKRKISAIRSRDNPVPEIGPVTERRVIPDTVRVTIEAPVIPDTVPDAKVTRSTEAKTVPVPEWRKNQLHAGFDIDKDRVKCKGEDGALPGAPRPFVPYTGDKTCCKKKRCHLYFNIDDIEAVRFKLHNGVRNAQDWRDRLQSLSNQYLCPNNQPPCVRFLMNVSGHSNQKMYGKTYGAVMRDSTKDVSILAWFLSIIPMLDAIPNPSIVLNDRQSDEEAREAEKERQRIMSQTREQRKLARQSKQFKFWDYDEEYQVHVATKAALYKMYMSDHQEFPDIYSPVSRDYFFKIWKQFYPNIKCRKYLRFSKCTICQVQRLIQYNRKLPKRARDSARKILEGHYIFIKQERAYSKFKKDKSLKEPTNYLWIAQDATEQLTYGLPHYLQLTSSEDKERLKMHLMIDYVAGK